MDTNVGSVAAAEARANAVAKLKRAASLPRMKDGRRPPMHGEAGGQSEGEHALGGADEKKDGASTGDTPSTPDERPAPSDITNTTLATSVSLELTSTEANTGDITSLIKDISTEVEPTTDLEPGTDAERARSPTPAESMKGNEGNATSKRRSRSRTRSRNSKDYRAKMRALEAATSASATGASDGPELDESDSAPVSAPLPAISPLLQNNPYALLQLQQLHFGGAPSLSPFGPTAQSMPLSAGLASGPGLQMPSLQALQSRHLQGLFRSNSETARRMAMHKLTGGAEPLEDFSGNGSAAIHGPGPAMPFGMGMGFLTPAALAGRAGTRGLSRNNTVAGGERIAARQQLLRRLNERIEKTDGDATSGAEESSTGTRRSRRRSRRKSATVVDDRELIASTSTAATTPSTTPAPSALNMLLDMGSTPSAVPNPLAMILLNAAARSPSVPLEAQQQQQEVSTSSRMPEFLRRTPTTPDPLAHLRRTPDPLSQLRSTPDLRSVTPGPRSTTPAPTFEQYVQDISQTPPHSQTQDHYQYDSPLGHRGLVVEEEDEGVPMRLTPPRGGVRAHALPAVRASPLSGMRMPHGSDAPSLGSASTSSDSGGGGSGAGRHNVPVILSDSDERSPFRQDVFPKSPFGTPIKEHANPHPHSQGRGQDEDEVLYGYGDADATVDTAATRARIGFGGSDREISWIADPVPVVPRRLLEKERIISWDAEAVPEARPAAERDVSWIAETSRMPVHDEDEEEEEEEEEEVQEVQEDSTRDEPLPTSRPHSRRTSPLRTAVESQEITVEIEGDNNDTPSYSTVPSQHSTTSTATMHTITRESNISDLSSMSAHRGDTPSQLIGRTHSQTESIQGWNEYQPVTDGLVELVTKRSADSSVMSAWSKVKNTFTRSASSLGRRSRTNSIVREKKGDTESSRESGSSNVSAKRESRGDGPVVTWQQQGPAATSPSPSTSVSMLSLIPSHQTRGGVSPIPPPLESDVVKYMDPKLFPFPGMKKLQEEQLRGRGMSLSMSSPDIVLQASTSGGMLPSANSSISSQTQESGRERKLSHQNSDSQLLVHYQNQQRSDKESSDLDLCGIPISSLQAEYFSVPTRPPPPPAINLPRTRAGVKRWLNERLFPGSSQSAPSSPSPTPPILDPQVHAESIKKPSLSDLLGRKAIGHSSDWEDVDKPTEDQSTTSRNTNTVKGTPVSTVSMKPPRDEEIQEPSPDDPVTAYQYTNAFHLPANGAVDGDIEETRESNHFSVPLSSHDPSSATPDPASSVESASQSSLRSRSSMGSIYSPQEPIRESAQATDILQRLDQVLHAEIHNRLWTSALTTPPRRLLLSSPMLQVANCDTVKDRFLFLFTDILVIAKPILPDRDSLLDPQKLYPPDRRFLIKNVVHLKDLRLNVDRDEDPNKPLSALVAQRPEFLRNFVQEFSEDQNSAIAHIVDVRDLNGCLTLGKLLVQLPELDRAKLGEYLSRRTSKHVLKVYIDAFGFYGLDIETSLRIFLLSIHIPSGEGHVNTLETLLDTFAGRWYAANGGIVAFDRDLAVRLVRAVVRLNEALHSAIAQESANANYTRPHVTSRDFTEAFRRHDARGLVSDSLLEKIYTSVRREKLCQARNPTNGNGNGSGGRAPHPVTLKRPVPARVTYNRQSEPIVVRIPAVDPQLTIRLYGQDLEFDPPALTFTRVAEASFRITGRALGPKRLILACSGPAAPNYAGLPLSTTIYVERAFMRNTFQVAFLDHTLVKRRYMFSVDDPVIRHEWTGSLKRQIEVARAGQSGSPEHLPVNIHVQVYRAAEALSFKVLQDTLLSSSSEVDASMTPNGTLRHVNGDAKEGEVQNGVGERKERYQRSRSRSQMYRVGAGRHEADLLDGGDDHIIESGTDTLDPTRHANAGVGGDQAVPPGAKFWTGSELERLCQQNSAIALVLSLLQAALPYDVDDELNPTFQFPSQAATIQRQPSHSSAYQI